MAVSLEVRGAEQFFELARRLREAGDRDLQRELYRGINRATKPLVGNIRQSALDVLPRSGGLAAHISTSRISTQRRTGANSVGIKVVTRPPKKGGSMGRGHDIAAMNRGRLRHPLFGNRRHWYTQTIAAGWWSIPTDRMSPQVRGQLLIAMENVKRKIEG